MNTTTQLEKVNVKVQKVRGLGNQQPSPVWGKVQRPSCRVLVDSKRRTPQRAGEDMVCSALRDAAVRKHGEGLTTLLEHKDYLGGFGIVHNESDGAQNRIIKWDTLT